MSLVLTRHEGEVIMVGDDVKIIVHRARDGKARIAIEAPKEIPVHREEIYQKIQRQKTNAD